MPVSRRRSVSIDQFVESSINSFRAGAITHGYDCDFTTMINAFAEYGLRKAQENRSDPILTQVFKKYFDYDELKEYGLVDEWKDLQEFKEFRRKKAQEVASLPADKSVV
jgi:hypothetical protein